MRFMSNNMELIFLIICLYFISTITTQNVSMITIPLNKSITYENKELYGKFHNLNSSLLLRVNFDSINPNVSFIIFQVHTHLNKVTLYKNEYTVGMVTFGSNIGLYSNTMTTDSFFIQNPSAFPVKIYISIHGYSKTDPIPGGCNLELPTPINPYMVLVYNDYYIDVDVAPPGDPLDFNCLRTKNIEVTFYLMYLPERRFEEDIYFEGIKDMITLDSIERKGTIVAQTIWPVRRMVSAYPGIGSIYVAVARNGAAYSVYVPTQTYACSPQNDSCELFDGIMLRFLCASLLFLGLFVCYYGHGFFKTEMFLVGFFGGVILTYIVISHLALLDLSALIVASTISGICFGAIWLIFWWLFGLPIFAVLLATLNLGFLIASIVYYRLPGWTIIDDVDSNFWSVFLLIMLLTSVVLMWMTFTANILCCAVLGGYMTVYPLDHYLGSNLKYIIINTIRRANVPGFNHAELMPPFQWRDVLVTTIWVVLSTSGFMFQYYKNKNRPPFPPPPRGVRARTDPPAYYEAAAYPGYAGLSPDTSEAVGERTPLLA